MVVRSLFEYIVDKIEEEEDTISLSHFIIRMCLKIIANEREP